MASIQGLALLVQYAFVLVRSQGPTTTVIDVLSDNVEFSYFLRMLQHNQLVPYLNQQTGITLVAPVNSAFAAELCGEAYEFAQSNSYSDGSCLDQIFDNFSLQDLKNYIITEPVNTTELKGSHLFSTVANTYDNTYMDDGVESPIIVNSRPGLTHPTINGIRVVEPNLFAESQRSYVQGIEKVLVGLKDVDSTVRMINDTTILNHLKGDHLAGLANKTILIPIDDSFHYYKDYELEYLFTKYAELDSQLIMSSLILDGMYAGDIFNVSTTDLDGNTVILSSEENGDVITLYDSIHSIRSNILAHGCVIHLFNSTDLIPAIQFNTLKTLVGLGATSFVDELLLEDLSGLITDNNLQQTIFYPKESGQMNIASKSSNLYHFVTERIDDLSSSKTLYDTRSCNTKRMGDSCQRIKVENFGDFTIMINNNVMVESGPYKVGNTVIYLTDDDIRTPGDILSSVNSAVFRCSQSLELLSDLGLVKLPNNHEGYTILLPCYDSWDDYALTLNYLKSNRNALESLMKNFVLEGLLYTDFMESESNFTNLNGKDVTMRCDGKDDSELNLIYDNTSVSLGIDNDIFFNQGVMHPIEKLFFPDEMHITLLDIFDHIASHTFLHLLSFFPDLYEVLESDSYSVLLPASHSLSRFQPPSSNSSLKDFLSIHIIPETSLDDLYECDDKSFATLNPSGVNLTCSKTEEGSSVLSLDGENGMVVKISQRGCTTGEKHSCVYLIERPIQFSGPDHYHISLPGPAVGLGMVIGALGMVGIVVSLLLVLPRQRAANAEGRGRETGQSENASLFNANENHRNGYESTTFESQYSANTSVDPIAFGKKKSLQHIV